MLLGSHKTKNQIRGPRNTSRTRSMLLGWGPKSRIQIRQWSDASRNPLEELLSHFERKLPVLMGNVSREKFTPAETRIMECFRKRSEAEEKIRKQPIWSCILELWGFGPWILIDRQHTLLGPDPKDLEVRIARWRNEIQEAKLVDV